MGGVTRRPDGALASCWASHPCALLHRATGSFLDTATTFWATPLGAKLCQHVVAKEPNTIRPKMTTQLSRKRYCCVVFWFVHDVKTCGNDSFGVVLFVLPLVTTAAQAVAVSVERGAFSHVLVSSSSEYSFLKAHCHHTISISYTTMCWCGVLVTAPN